MSESFSKRLGFRTNENKEITIKEDAPKELRDFLIQTIYSYNYKPSFLRKIICRTLRISSDENNWTEYPNIEFEVNYLIRDCEWYKVYDVIEAFALNISDNSIFHDEINEYFKVEGIGWKLQDGNIISRGDEGYELATKETVNILTNSKLTTASNEMKEAFDDLSKKPHPDITGAIQHSAACLECVCREFSGERNSTLGQLIKKNPNIFPSPLNNAISLIWGYTSEQGRHLKEGRPPEYPEAEFIVGLSSVMSSYLSKKLNINNIEIISEIEDDDIPF